MNVTALVLQAFVASRLVKYAGLRGALLALPLIALGGYATIAAGASFVVVRWIKTAENATDYSIMNTARQLLWLPTSREEKYKAKQAIDTFFVRGGDLLSAAVVYRWREAHERRGLRGRQRRAHAGLDRRGAADPAAPSGAHPPRARSGRRESDLTRAENVLVRASWLSLVGGDVGEVGFLPGRGKRSEPRDSKPGVRLKDLDGRGVDAVHPGTILLLEVLFARRGPLGWSRSGQGTAEQDRQNQS